VYLSSFFLFSSSFFVNYFYFGFAFGFLEVCEAALAEPLTDSTYVALI
jgi:hypothetical protein